MQRPLAFWISLKSSLWFVPTVVVIVSMTLAEVLVVAGVHVPMLAQERLPALLGFGPEGSREMLSAIATAMITIAGVAFSVTIVALSLSSSQYSPRVLRQFMRNRTNQWVLGVFVGVFAYCLVLLPQVRGGDDNPFVPAVAVAGGVIYALVGVACLILFIHHVATSIQASCIVESIAAETREAAEREFPEELNATTEEPALADQPGAWHAVVSPESGYIQLVDEEELVELAAKHDVIVRMEREVGKFVIAGTSIAAVNKPLAPEVNDAFSRFFTISRTRTVEQDVTFGIRQIVDIALRALSPALNDPTTAALCVDYLSTILHQLATRRMGNRYVRHEGLVRMITLEPDFASTLAQAFGEIRICAREHVAVLERMIHRLQTIGDVTRPPQRRASLAAEAEAIRALLARNDCDPAAAAACALAERLIARLA